MPFADWPQEESDVPVERIIQLYDHGFAGAKADPEAQEALRHQAEADGFYADAADAAHANGFADSAAGKLVIPFVHVESLFPGCWPGPAQQRGSCVVHNQRNAHLLTLTCEIVAGTPDPVTGRVEGKPNVTPEGIKNGVIQSATWYWFRGSNGDGWSCATAVSVAINRIGVALCQAYPELELDLTLCNGKNEGLWGRSPPPAKVVDAFGDHKIRTATECSTFEEVRDMLANGYGISTCGSEGWGSTRNEDGLAQRRGSWAHAMALIGADDRAETKQKYGEPLVLVLNSWGKGWIGGPRRIMGTSIDIPEGSFWSKWSDFKRRYMVALSGFNGWPAQKLPDAGFDPNILG